MSADRRRTWRSRGAIVAALALVSAALGILPQLDYLHRLGIDLLLPLRHQLYGPLFPAAESDVVAVVIDEETYGTEPFAATPQVAWTPYLAQVLDAVAAAGPRVIGLDLVYPTSLDRPGLVPGYDKPLLKTFLKIGRSGKLVLGQIRLSQQAINPYRGQIVAAGGAGNLRPLSLVIDGDDVVRRYATAFATEDGGSVPSFAVELVRRAGGTVAEGEFLINYNTGADDIPVFGLADLLACSTGGRTAFFEHFRDKVVIFGTALDVEDRRVPAKRFAMGRSDRSLQPRCGAPFDASRFGELIVRHSMPGLFVHAAAVNTLTKGLELALLAPGWRALLLAALTGVAAVVFFALAPLWGAVALLAIVAATTLASVAVFAAGLVPPVVLMAAAALLGYTAIYAYRFVIEDKDKRWIQHAFRHYLAPSLVDRLARDSSALALGGTRRTVTVFFSDLAGFTTFSESLRDTPEVLVEILNEYLTVVTDVIERHGGYVDKYIGDAVMAIWGAPLDDEHGERRAVDAAIEAQTALDAFNLRLTRERPGMAALHTRIGLNTGPAFVGNMGSRTRLNYTVGGDTVNLAARLEGANKVYGSRILIGEATAAALGEDYVIRCVDYLAVKGKAEPVRVFEVLGHSGEVAAQAKREVTTFEAAYKMYLERQFDAAAAAFEHLAAGDKVAALYVERCAHFIARPPDAEWDGSFVMETK